MRDTSPPPDGVSVGPRVFLLIAVAIILAATVVRTYIWWTTNAGVNLVSGVMIAMAADLKSGVFYRPLFDSAGYGGTRYAPLYFSLHALLLKLGVPMLLGAYLLSAAAILLLMLGVFQLLKKLGVESWLAACSAKALLASFEAQLSLCNPRADGLAAALNVWGLAAIARPPYNRRMILLASVLFTLAWSAKITTTFGFAAAFIWLIATGYRRVAWVLAAETCAGYLMVAAAIVILSQGRVVHIFRACASGGTNWRFFGSAPLRVAAMAFNTDTNLVLFAVIGSCFVLFSSKLLQNLPALLLIATMLTTIMIFGSPGTGSNHLLDVEVAGVILLAAWLGNVASPLQKQLGIYALAVVTALAAMPLLRYREAWGSLYHPHQFQRIVEVIGYTDKPILSDNPVIPVLSGQWPYVLDPWMLLLLREHTPDFGNPVVERLRNQSFGAVVLTSESPLQKFGRWKYDLFFGSGFSSALSENYHAAQVIGRDWIYLPNTGGAARESGAK